MQAKHDGETESAPKGDHGLASRRRSRRIALVVAAIAALSAGLLWGFAHYYSGTTATLGNRVIRLEVVNTDAARERGLSGRDSLPEDGGMLFVFDKPGAYCFWMKDMRFPIDMIWLDEQKRVVKIQKNASPDTYPTNFCPATHAKYVVEVGAGVSDKSGLKEGDQVRMRSGLVL